MIPMWALLVALAVAFAVLVGSFVLLAYAADRAFGRR